MRKKLRPVGILIRLILREHPSSLAWLVLGGLLAAAQVLFLVSIPKLLIDAYTKNSTVPQLVQLILLLAGVKFLLSAAGKWAENRQKISTDILRNKYLQVFSEKILSVDYALLEDPQMLELRESGLFALTGYRALDSMFESLTLVFSGAITLLSVTLILLSFSAAVFFLLLGLTLLSALLSLYGVKKRGQYTKQLIPINRVYNYYFGKAYEDAMQKDYRMYDLGKLVVRAVKELNESTAKWILILRMLQGAVLSSQALIQALITFAVMLAAAYRTQGLWGEAISVADFTLIVGVAVQFSQAFLGAMNGLFNVMLSLSMLEPLAAFMNLPESRRTSGDTLPGAFESFAFRHVHFTYPGGERKILEDVSFRIEKGEHISLVGVNNAGKTTIVKLICRLFEPDEGEILYNGRPVQEYDYQEYLRLLATVFQDFQLLPFTLRENLSAEKSEEEILRTLERVGMEEQIEQLPNGLGSFLNKQLHEGGVDFSGGERQKLAIARSILKDGELIILDEPTAALDPFAESEIYEHFAEMVKGKTTIFISHRMSSSLFCDKILLLEGGRVAAFDTHEELMKTENMYRRLFLAQAAHYRS